MSDTPTEDPQAGAGDGGGAAGSGGGGAAQPATPNPGGGGGAQPGDGGGGGAQPGTADPAPPPGGQPAPGGPEPQHGAGDPQSGGDQGVVPAQPGPPGQGGLPGQHGQTVDPGAHQARDHGRDDDGPDVEYIQVHHTPHHDPGAAHHAEGGDGMSVSIEPGSVHATAQRMRATSAELRHHTTHVAPHAVLSPFPPEARAALEHRLTHLLATLHQLVEELEHEAADLEHRAGHAESDGLHDVPTAAGQAEWAGASGQGSSNVASAALGGGIAAAAGGLAGRRESAGGSDEDDDATRS